MNHEDERSLSVNGKTVEEAIEEGLTRLGVDRTDVDIKILKEGKRGVFGIGAEEAEVQLTLKSASADEPASTPDEPPAPSDDTPPEDAATVPDDEEEADQPAAEVDDETAEVAVIATDYLRELLKYMGVEAEVSWRMATDLVEADEEPPLVLDVTGNDLGILIGRRNETLQALQYMVRLMISKHMRHWQPVVIDVESYRVRRRQSLQQIAQKMAERAVSTGRRVALEAMSAYERRIVHIALRDNPAVDTKSVGSNDNRKVTIIPK